MLLTSLVSPTNLFVYGNDQLTSLSMPALTTVDGRVRVNGNPSMTSASVPKLSSVSDVEIAANDALTSFDVSALTELRGDLPIRTSPALETLEGFGSLATIGGRLMLIDNGLSDLSALDSLTTVNGDILIAHNRSLTGLDGLSGITNHCATSWFGRTGS